MAYLLIHLIASSLPSDIYSDPDLMPVGNPQYSTPHDNWPGDPIRWSRGGGVRNVKMRIKTLTRDMKVLDVYKPSEDGQSLTFIGIASND